MTRRRSRPSERSRASPTPALPAAPPMRTRSAPSTRPGTSPTRATPPRRPRRPPPPTFNFSPEADARVQASATTTNYATSNLRVDGGTNPAVESLLRFTVSGAPAGINPKRQAARVRIQWNRGRTGCFHHQSGVDRDGGQLEQPSRRARARRPTTRVQSRRTAGSSTTSRPFVTGNGTYSFGLAGTSSDGVDFRSREAATDRPVLIVTTGAPDTQKPTPPPSSLAATVDERVAGRSLAGSPRATTSA